MTTHVSRRAWMIAAGVVVLILIVVGVRMVTRSHATADKSARGAAAAPVQVTTAAVAVRDVPIYKTGIGTVIATQSVTVKTRIDGQLERVGFSEGQDVKAGQVIAVLDPRTYQAQLAQAEAQKARDQAQLGNARADLARYTKLIGEDAATQQQVDTQKALVAQLVAAVQTDDAAVNFAKVQLSFTTITAPIGGRVGARLVDAGNIVHAADASGLVVINQIDPITVLFTLPEENFQDINRALHESSAPLQVIAYPRNGEQPLGTGKLTLLNNQIDTASGTVQLKALFPNPGHALWPGQYVNVRVVLRHDPGALTVPAAAVQRSQDGTFVWSIGAGGKAANAPVEVASIQDGIAVIARGVQAGEKVVVDGQYKLKPGIAVSEGASAPARGASGTTGRRTDAAASAGAATSGSGS